MFAERSFSDFDSTVKITFDRWLQLSLTTSLYDWMIKNKIILFCNANLVLFLIEGNPHTIEDLIRIGDQYYAAHPMLKVQKEVPFQAFTCEGGSEIAYDETDACAVQSFPCRKPHHQGSAWG